MSDMNSMQGSSDGKNPMPTSQGLPIPPNMNLMAAPAPGSHPVFPGQPWTNPLAAPAGSVPTQPLPSQQQQLFQLQLRRQQLQIQQLQAQQQNHVQQHSQNMVPSPSQRSVAPKSSFQAPIPSFPPSTSLPTPGGSEPPKALPVLQAKRPEPTAFPADSSTSTPAKAAARKPKASSPDKKKPSREQVVKWISQCDWADKAIYVSRQLLGGSSVNGFVKATAAAQRIKRQRARQTAKSEGGTKPMLPLTDPHAEEERLKHETMNVRTAKKIKEEMETGVQWCVGMHATIRTILHQLDPHSMPPPLSWNRNSSMSFVPSHVPPSSRPAALPQRTSSTPSVTTTSKAKRNSSDNLKKMAAPLPSPTMSPGDPNGSTLRKQRKRRTTADKQENYVPPGLVEHDAVSGKRVFTKKEHLYRIFEVLRFRELRKGDYVAARVSSRDLWILAKVVKEFPNMPIDPIEFLLLKQPKRDSLFREKVLVKDVEEKEGSGPTLVSRPLVLPLPRSYAEAADWGSRLKKGCRVYAMYPTTTSLYPATVTDNTTYCREEDDIIVVEFDEDERDATGALPKWHIPARFVTLIPKEFPASHTDGSKMKRESIGSTSAKSAGDKRSNSNASSDPSSSSRPSHKRVKTNDSTDSVLDGMMGELEDIGDFDLGFNLDSEDFAMQPGGDSAAPP